MSVDGQFGRLFELTEDAVAVIELVDGAPVVRAVNPAFVDVFGYDRADVVGSSLNEFIVPETRRHESVEFDQRTKRGQFNQAVVSRQTADGIRRFRYRGVPYTDGGSPYGLAIYADITDRYRRERTHHVLQRTLQQALADRLPAVEDAVADAAGGAPTGAAVERLERLTGELEAVCDRVAAAEDVLGTSHIDWGVTDLSRVLREAVAAAREESSSPRVEADVPDGLRATTDDRVGVAVENLLASARDRAATEVEVTASRDGGEAVVSVADDGPGLSERVQQAIFDDRPVSRPPTDGVLGLWVTKWLVEEYGGWLSSTRADGETVVTVRLPTPDDE